jgi:hypothetical protein
MKTGLLISSIFYIIGLFFGSKVEKPKNVSKVEKIIMVDPKSTGQNQNFPLTDTFKLKFPLSDSVKKNSEEIIIKTGVAI